MKKYQCHKVVEAARIVTISCVPHKENPFGQREFVLDDGESVFADGSQFDKAEMGGYFLRYADGYESYSPAKAFEEGYTEIVDSPSTTSNGAGVVADTRDAKPAAPTGPRVTLEDIHAAIASEYYFTAWEGVHGHSGNDSANLSPAASQALGQVTYCVLVLKNGHRIVGVNEGPVSAENFDANLGRKYAHEDAIEQCWPLFGFALKDRLYRGQ